MTAASGLGFVRGVTTNPALMRAVTGDPLRHARDLLAATDLPTLFYQPSGAYGDLWEEAMSAWSWDRDRVVLKLPATPTGVPLAAAAIAACARVALTSVQAPTAMTVAEALGCAGVIPYVDRAWRDPRTDTDLVRSLAAVRRERTPIIAASVKNAGQFTRSFADGADAVTAPLAVLEQLLRHPAGLEAEEEFAARYRPAVPAGVAA